MQYLVKIKSQFVSEHFETFKFCFIELKRIESLQFLSK